MYTSSDLKIFLLKKVSVQIIAQRCDFPCGVMKYNIHINAYKIKNSMGGKKVSAKKKERWTTYIKIKYIFLASTCARNININLNAIAHQLKSK